MFTLYPAGSYVRVEIGATKTRQDVLTEDHIDEIIAHMSQEIGERHPYGVATYLEDDGRIADIYMHNDPGEVDALMDLARRYGLTAKRAEVLGEGRHGDDMSPMIEIVSIGDKLIAVRSV